MAAKKGSEAIVGPKGVYWSEICQEEHLDVVWIGDANGQSSGGYGLAKFDLVRVKIEVGKTYVDTDKDRVNIVSEPANDQFVGVSDQASVDVYDPFGRSICKFGSDLVAEAPPSPLKGYVIIRKLSNGTHYFHQHVHLSRTTAQAASEQFDNFVAIHEITYDPTH